MRLRVQTRVKEMMTHNQIHEQLADYVLGTLAPGQSDEVIEHVAGCAECRRAIQEERAIGERVRGTLNAVTRPDAAQLRRLMPQVARRSARGKGATTWTNRLAPVMALLLLAAGTLMINRSEAKRPMSFFMAATATATSTNTPTATVSRESGGDAAAEQAFVSMPTSPAEIAPAAPSMPAPVPQPTPVAAINQMAVN